VANLEPLLRFWRALDGRFESVEPTWWGAVVTDSRYPTIWDANYARVEATDASLTLAEVQSHLLPAIERSGATRMHVVMFHPESQRGLLAEAGTRGDRITWDLLMEERAATRKADHGPPPQVEEIERFDSAFWDRFRESLREFDITEEDAKDAMVLMEREIMLPAGKRWFAVREGRRRVAFGTLLVLEEVGYVDGVVTFPAARRRGYAAAIMRRIAEEARAAGARHLYLLAEPDGGARGLYERLGFAGVATLASTLGPR